VPAASALVTLDANAAQYGCREENKRWSTSTLRHGETFGLSRWAREGLMPFVDGQRSPADSMGSYFNHMLRTVQLAKQHGVKVAPIPRCPDLRVWTQGNKKKKIGREED